MRELESIGREPEPVSPAPGEQSKLTDEQPAAANDAEASAKKPGLTAARRADFDQLVTTWADRRVRLGALSERFAKCKPVASTPVPEAESHDAKIERLLDGLDTEGQRDAQVDHETPETEPAGEDPVAAPVAKTEPVEHSIEEIEEALAEPVEEEPVEAPEPEGKAAAKCTDGGFAMLPISLCSNEALSLSMRILIYMGRRHGDGSNGRGCYESITKIAKAVGTDRETASRVIKKLVRAGILTEKTIKGGREWFVTANMRP
jgi:hypothetical protein